jgi:hypothetical protein
MTTSYDTEQHTEAAQTVAMPDKNAVDMTSTARRRRLGDRSVGVHSG